MSDFSEKYSDDIISSHSESKPILKFRYAAKTDIGGGRENQDDYFILDDFIDKGIIIICVLDGHGRIYGKINSYVAKESILKYVQRREEIIY